MLERARPNVRVLGDDHEPVTRALAERGSEPGLRNVAVRNAEVLHAAVFLQDK
jgi:hypothetical protein